MARGPARGRVRQKTCMSTALNRCSVTEMCGNKNAVSHASPIAALERRPTSYYHCYMYSATAETSSKPMDCDAQLTGSLTGRVKCLGQVVQRNVLEGLSCSEMSGVIVSRNVWGRGDVLWIVWGKCLGELSMEEMYGGMCRISSLYMQQL